MTLTATTSGFGLDELEPAELLERVTRAETAERAAALRKLELAAQWCVVHPVSDQTEAAVWGDAGLPGLSECDETLGGDGCPLVSAFAPEPFAAALGVSTMTGMQLLADALDLTHRLPAIWRRVQRLEVPAWKARRVAQATHSLSRAAAAYVDDHLADRLASCGATLIDRTVAQAIATHEPETQAVHEQSGRAAWDVTLLHRTDGGWAGTSHLEATGDTLDLAAFYDLVCDHAHHLGTLGDTDALGARKAKALGLIADSQTHLDLFGLPPTDQDGADDPTPVRRTTLTKTRLYLHLRLADVVALPDRPVFVGEVERLGPVTLDRIREWLGSSRATVVPVLDLGRDDAVDQHDPPEWMREAVILRDPYCVFPWCRRDARACDLDHIEPYVPLDQGGPPGQTSPTKLAPLCRRHHNAKTTRRWRYQRNRDGTYTWHGPHARTYLVTQSGTTALPHV
jgi:hypothetical protein